MKPSNSRGKAAPLVEQSGKTYREIHALDKKLLASSLVEALSQEPDLEIAEVAQEISHVCRGRNGEFVAIGFVAAYQYFWQLKRRDSRGKASGGADV